MTQPPLAGGASTLLAAGLRHDDRVLVTGAGGWFGSTVLALLHGLLPVGQVLATASVARPHRVAEHEWLLHGWDDRLVQQFAPTLVLNFAFLTRGFAASMTEGEYGSVNQQLTGRFLSAAQLPSVRLGLTVSSGAAVTESGHPYGRMKLEEERAALDLTAPERRMVVARAYSLSGPFVRHPYEYAFSSFVEQAAGGIIRVQADRPTYRRYCDVSEFLAVAVRSGLGGWSGVIESGGELVEMGELAQRIADAAGADVVVTRAPQQSPVSATYASDDADWQRHCALLGFTPLSLTDQIAAAVSRRRMTPPDSSR